MDSRLIKNYGKPGSDTNLARIKELAGLARPFSELADLIEKEFAEPALEADYAKAAWPYLRADKDGANRKLHEILKLLRSVEQGETK